MIRSIQRMCIIARVVIFSVYCVSGTSNVFFPLKWSTINSHLLELFARRQHIRVCVCFNNLASARFLLSEYFLFIVGCGRRYLFAQGRSVWKKWKKRYYILVQVKESALCAAVFKEGHTPEGV